MCTVTFIPTKEGFFLTSSRDERMDRRTVPPLSYMHDGEKLIYPKDELSGGTWIAVSPMGRAACLLNGAFINHDKLKGYTKSRGLVLLESFKYKSTPEFIVSTDFNNIEPFTLLTLDYESGKLSAFYEFRWDGKQKHIKQLNISEEKIWSSATLYSPEVQKMRNKLFENWLESNKLTEDKLMMNFHNRKHGLNPAEDILMTTEKELKTVSISQIALEKGDCHFKYFDVDLNKEYITQLNSLENEKA